MADIPIDYSLPERPIKQETSINPAAMTVNIRSQADFFNTLSEQSIKLYSFLKNRQAIDQFSKAQIDVQTAMMGYKQWVNDNPAAPDIELNQFGTTIKNAQKTISDYLTNGVAQREFNDWFAKEIPNWSDQAMDWAGKTDTQLKRNNLFDRYETLLNLKMTDIDEKGMQDIQQQIDNLFITAQNQGILKPNEQEELQQMINTGKAQVQFNWYKSKMLAMPQAEFDKVIRAKSLPLDTAQRKRIEDERDFYDAQANDELKKKQNKDYGILDNALFDGTITWDMVKATSLDEKDKGTYWRMAEGEIQKRAKPKDVETNFNEYDKILLKINEVRSRKLNWQDLFKEISSHRNKDIAEPEISKLQTLLRYTMNSASPLNSDRARIYFSKLDKDYKNGTIDNPLEYDKKNDELTNFFLTKPDATPEEAKKKYDELTGANKESRASKLLNTTVGIWRIGLGMPKLPKPKTAKEQEPIKREVELESAPAMEFDDIWPNLDDETKKKALAAIKNGYTPEQVRAALEIK